jgi:anti-anti-sigma regulatory factor
VVAVQGLTHGTDAGPLAELLEELLAEGQRKIVVDLRAPQLLNSKLLDALVRVSDKLDPRRGEGIAVVTETGYVATMLEIAASGGLLILAASLDEALDALAELD